MCATYDCKTGHYHDACGCHCQCGQFRPGPWRRGLRCDFCRSRVYGDGACLPEVGRLSHRTGSDDRRVCTASAGGDPHGGPHLARGRGGRGRASGQLYRTSLTLAAEAGFRSIAFPLISAGIYGYPLKQALEIAVSSMQAFLAEHEMQVYLTVLEEKLIPLAESFLRRKGEEV